MHCSQRFLIGSAQTVEQVKVAGGTLHIRPLTQSWVHECGSLLTNAFADAMGYLPVYRSALPGTCMVCCSHAGSCMHCGQPPNAACSMSASLSDGMSCRWQMSWIIDRVLLSCRTYLRHQIRQYLQRHAEMPPKAIVLIALLVPDPETDSQEQQEVMSSRYIQFSTSCPSCLRTCNKVCDTAQNGSR